MKEHVVNHPTEPKPLRITFPYPIKVISPVEIEIEMTTRPIEVLTESAHELAAEWIGGAEAARLGRKLAHQFNTELLLKSLIIE